ncbi:MAG TPA: glycine--tRNA ligase subunit beta, partial [Gaiellales bacterium]|nr:glycine--tRNA ligase subunit beta [Gaiellales bacterium]
GSGSLSQKTERMRVLADRLAVQNELAAAEAGAAARAAALAKADLVSGLVSEFADLQGFAGSLYAADAGEPDLVCRAVAEHHRPTEAGGETPDTVAGAVVSLADKLDTIGVAFALGLQPTGSRDPYGLRRAAAGIVAVALERGFELRLESLFEVVVGNLDASGTRVTREMRDSPTWAVLFVLDRVDAALLDEGVPVEEVRAARGSGEDEPVALAALARALHEAGRERLEPLRSAYARCSRIAAADGAGRSPVDRALLAETAERDLADAVEAVDEAIAECVAVGDHPGALVAAAELVPAVNRFFADVLVMADDSSVKANRLRLVGEAASTLRTLGDFEQLPG